MVKICSIVGARPQFVKAAPLSRHLKKKFTEVLIHTGQHYDPEMSQLFFKELKIPRPQYNLGIGSASHAQQTGRIMMALEPILLRENPSLVIVYGDTNSTLAGALTASKLHLPIAHVEAGMRSFNRQMPEEINRILTDHVSNLLFCSTLQSSRWLKKEGIISGVHVVGDIMLDAFKFNIKIADRKSKIMEKLNLSSGKYLLLTIHRAENTDNKKNFESIIKTLIRLNQPIIFPVHPRTRKYLEKYKEITVRIKKSGNIKLIKPVGYLDMMKLAKNAQTILTDSGGLQKEAYFLKIPCLTLREETEWIETLNGGWNQIVGTKPQKILRAFFARPRLSTYRQYFGHGATASAITKIIYEYCS